MSKHEPTLTFEQYIAWPAEQAHPAIVSMDMDFRALVSLYPDGELCELPLVEVRCLADRHALPRKIAEHRYRPRIKPT